ncbi:hypothetical protein [Streptomyces capparidis]
MGVSLPRRNSLIVTATLVVLTSLFTTILLIIRDVKRPFGGLVKVNHTAMTQVEDSLTRSFTAGHGNRRLSCEEDGDRRSSAAG